MKRALSAVLLALLLSAVGMTKGFAYDFSKVCSTGQTLYYDIIDATNHYVEMTYPGTSSLRPWNGYTKPTGNITLPSSVTYNGVTYTVKSIDHDTFSNCSGLTGSLTIPNSVTWIGDYAFQGCSGFTGSLTLPSSVTSLRIGVFQNCSGFTGTLTIPNSVTVINNNAFCNCPGFTGSLTIPNSVTSIGVGAFKYCTGFTYVFYNAVDCADVTIDAKPFEGCQGTLTIGSSVQHIPAYMFYGCSGFTGALTIPNAVTSIGDGAFRNCTGITRVNFNAVNCADVSDFAEPFCGCGGRLTIGGSVQRIPASIFSWCTDFTGYLTIPNSVTTIGHDAFYSCSGFTSTLTIGNSVTTIGYNAFMGCSGFTGSLDLPNSLTTIGTAAFFGCSGFTGSLTIPNSVSSIDNDAFTYCNGFSGSLTIGTAVTSMGRSAFEECRNFTQVYYNAVNCADVTIDDTPFEYCGGTLTIGSSVQRIPAYMFYKGILFTGALTIPNSVTTIGDYAFYECRSFNGRLTIGNSVTSIGQHAFQNCYGLNYSLTIPNSVTEIGIEAFRGCTGFTGSLTLGNSVTTIGSYAFYNCTGFTGSLTLGNSVATIGSYAFYNCSGFTGLTLGNSVTTIGASAFYSCRGLRSMELFPETPPILGTNVFQNVSKTIPVLVPCVALEDYQANEGWNVFTNTHCKETMTVYDGTMTNYRIPAYIIYFDDFTKSQFVIPAEDLADMTSSSISSMTFYTTSSNVPYITESSADVYLKEVNYTEISDFEPKVSATTVYSGYLNIVSAGNGGEMTINFNTPYTYNGGNLLIGIENTNDNGWKNISFYGQTVNGASISGKNSSSTGTITAEQQNFIPKTTFGFQSACKTVVDANYPFIEDFEGTTFAPTCWETVSNGSYHWTRNTNYVHSGSASAYSEYYGDIYLVMPDIKISSYASTAQLSFWSYNTWTADFEEGYNKVVLLDGSTETVLWSAETVEEEWVNTTIDLSAYVGQTISLAFKYVGNDGNGWYVDDVEVTAEAPITFFTNGYWNDDICWSTGEVPAMGSNVVIRANAVVPAGYAALACHVTLADNGSLTVADGGQLKHNTDGLVVTMKKNIEAYSSVNGTDNYHLLSFPFSQPVAVPSSMTASNGNDFYSFDGNYPDEEWRNSKQEPITTLEPVKGYLYANPTFIELSLTGSTYSSIDETKTLTLPYTEGSTNPSNGWALLGNPYTCDAYVYSYNCNNELVAMDVMVYDENGDMLHLSAGPVAPMQGFFVKVTEPTLVYIKSNMDPSARSYVDLGLPSGTLWATFNIGANAPEDYGDYFAWGETTPKDDYSWSTYQYCNGSENTLTKYCNDAEYGYNGFTDNLTTLLPEDDAATANWGNDWRIPAIEEWQELVDNTTCTWTTQNGVNGRLFTASNGNSIFMPAAGYFNGSSLSYADYACVFWSNPIDTNWPSTTSSAHFNPTNIYLSNHYYRYLGVSVRPVRATQPASSTYIVTATPNSVGGGTVTNTQQGQTCTVTATANDGYTFLNWTENGTVVSTNAIYTFTVNGNRNLVANFQLLQYTISVSANPSVGGTVTGGGSYNHGQTCVVRATAQSGYTFTNWTENGLVVSSNATYTFRVNSNRNLVANFVNPNGKSYVNLGLPSGTLWATCNVGADTPEDYGDYFAWGETTPKDYYGWDNYQHCYIYSTNAMFTKYCSNSYYGYNGFTDDLTTLLPEDDAATDNWGGSWRMPTKEEWEELLNYTGADWTTQNGVYGLLFTGGNGNSIFLPAAGFNYGTSGLNETGSNGYYWSSRLYQSYPDRAWIFRFNAGMEYHERRLGGSVRPVCSVSKNNN